MKASELRDLSLEELQKKLTDFKDELFSLRFQETILREIELEKNKLN